MYYNRGQIDRCKQINVKQIDFKYIDRYIDVEQIDRNLDRQMLNRQIYKGINRLLLNKQIYNVRSTDRFEIDRKIY